MKNIQSFLNSSFGLLLSGAVLSGLIIPVVTFKWQDKQWYNQQVFTAKQALFQKELDSKYQLVTEANEALADILTHSQIVAVCYKKGVYQKQLNDEINNYNNAVKRWEKKSNVIKINLEAFFHNKEIFKEWAEIKRYRNSLDLLISEIKTDKRKIGAAFQTIQALTQKQKKKKKKMIMEIEKIKLQGVAVSV